MIFTHMDWNNIYDNIELLNIELRLLNDSLRRISTQLQPVNFVEEDF